jgi:predicted dehydrogenase
MTKNSLVVGMGIGQLYYDVLMSMGHNVITVDANPEKNADFVSIETLLSSDVGVFDTVHICTPNYTHSTIATQLMPYAKIMFIEKPGVQNSSTWAKLIDNDTTRVMLVKNNMWRDNINELVNLASMAKEIRFNWINKNRIPHPGSWFTTKSLSFGGVSRDLMPHLLSLKLALCKVTSSLTYMKSERNWELSDIESTDYGTVNKSGTYDVDDHAEIEYSSAGKIWKLTADWASKTEDCRNIEFVMPDNTIVVEDLGLCPESAYRDMIIDCIANVNNDEFWREQNKTDYLIHSILENMG